ncbi:hypothetical protein N8739_00690 [Luminiphilus sp.]|nr:hypothetical protein [Luminiphilus sp.]
MNEVTAAIQLAKEAARNSDKDWTDIILELTGVELERNKHCPCPIHEGLHEANDNGFRLVKLYESGGEDGVFHCAGKGSPHSGDGFEIVHRLLQLPKMQVAELIYNAAGGTADTKEASEAAQARKQKREAKEQNAMDEKQKKVLELYACAVKRSKKLEGYTHPYAIKKGLSTWTELVVQRSDWERIAKETDSTDSRLLMVVPRISLETSGIVGLEFITDEGKKWTYGALGYATVPYHMPGTYVAVVEGYASAAKTQEVLNAGGAFHIRAVAAGGKHQMAKAAKALGNAFVVAEYDAGGYSRYACPSVEAPYSDAGNDICDYQNDSTLVTEYFNRLVLAAQKLGAHEHVQETLEQRWERVFKYWDRWDGPLDKTSEGAQLWRESRGIAA